jgi:hypothetical protein
MFDLESFLFWGLCLAPVVALVFVLPWKKIFTKKVKQPKVKEQKSAPVEEKKPIPTETDQPKEQLFTPRRIERKNEFKHVGAFDKEFDDYLNLRKNNMSMPERKELPEGFEDKSFPFTSSSRRNQKEEKTIVEEIETLSPELKALIISGALDRKDFDDIGENK